MQLASSEEKTDKNCPVETILVVNVVTYTRIDTFHVMSYN